MTVSAKTLEAINREAQKVPIDDKRWPELAIELNQLRSAAEAALRQHDFDRDPSEFLSLLRAHRP
jgi:hypothetical protein